LYLSMWPSLLLKERSSLLARELLQVEDRVEVFISGVVQQERDQAVVMRCRCIFLSCVFEKV
jgi:hypothetical protein